MGREIKRVVANFDWPIGKLWEGYVNPHHKAAKCLSCDGTGLSGAAKNYQDQWYGYVHFAPDMTESVPFSPLHPIIAKRAERNYPNDKGRQGNEAQRLAAHFNSTRMHHLTQWEVDALLKADRLYDFTRVPRTDKQREAVKKKMAAGGNSWLLESNGYHPTAQEVNEWSIDFGTGHDSINQWTCAKAYCRKHKMPYQCDVCKGDGELWASKKEKKIWGKWERFDPPTGEWYQLWSTTTEGHPMTPAFETPEELARHCAANRVSTFSSDTADFETWLAFIRGPGWAPSMIGCSGHLASGVAAAYSK